MEDEREVDLIVLSGQDVGEYQELKSERVCWNEFRHGFGNAIDLWYRGDVASAECKQLNYLTEKKTCYV